MAKIPFLSYHILPTQAIIRNNIHIGHVKEDIEVLLIALAPVLYISHRDIPKPHELHENIIQNLTIKPITMKLLPLLGWVINNETGKYTYLFTDSPHEMANRKKAAHEFRKFYNELVTAKDRNPRELENFLSTQIVVPFSSYSQIPAQSIVKSNVSVGHIKEDIESLCRSLIPLLLISQPDVPKPTVLHSQNIIKLASKTGTVELLALFGYFINNEKDYVLRNSKSIDEVARRLEAAKEFRRFYDELKKGKEDNVNVIEYYLSHSNATITSAYLCF